MLANIDSTNIHQRKVLVNHVLPSQSIGVTEDHRCAFN